MKFLKNNILYIVVSLVGVLVLITIYRVYFSLDKKEIAAYIQDEVNKYDASERVALAKIIEEGVNYILLNESLYKQVKLSARASSISIEQELVHAAIMQCKQFGYIATKPTTTA